MIYYEKLFGNCNHCLIRLISFLEMGTELNCQYYHVYNYLYLSRLIFLYFGKLFAEQVLIFFFKNSSLLCI